MLTDLSIKKLKAPAKGQTTYKDSVVRGFGVRVSQGGTMSFVLMHGPARQLTTIGRVGIIKLAEAREEAKKILANETLGRRSAPSLSFEDAFETYKATKLAGLRKSTAHEAQRVIKTTLLPKLRHRKLGDIQTHHLTDIFDKMAKTPSAANHSFMQARAFFRWAVKRRLIPHSPLEGLGKPHATASRERTLSDEELAKVWAAAKERGDRYGRIILLLILTGQRRGEIAGLRVGWYSHNQQTVTLPSFITKNGREHTFAVGPMTRAVLEESLPEQSREESLEEYREQFLFPARSKEPKPLNGWSKIKREFDTKCGVKFTLHDLRRTLRTNWARLRINREVAEKYINHVSGVQEGVEGIYDRHSYLPEMREAAAKWEELLASLTGTATVEAPEGSTPDGS